MADIADTAVEIVAENKFADKITIIKGKVEEVKLPVENVDIIISEWMGYFLLYESMLDCVLFARDKWLVEGGLLFPDVARLYVCALEDEKYRRDKLDYWNDVYGYKMSAIKKIAMMEPLVDIVPGNQIVSNACCVLELDLHTITKEDLDFESSFEIIVNRQEFIHGLTAFFDVKFSPCHVETGFTTAPFAEYTHWKHTVFYYDESLRGTPNHKLCGTIKVQKHPKNPRDLVVDLKTFGGSHGREQQRRYLMR